MGAPYRVRFQAPADRGGGAFGAAGGLRGGVVQAAQMGRIFRYERHRGAREVHRPELTHAEFERVVSEALESLPPRFAQMVENVVIAVEDEPNDDDLASFDDDGSDILGIYRGVALTERTHDMQLLPDEIAVFRGPINRMVRSRREAVSEVRETVIHELGHYFGLADDDMPH